VGCILCSILFIAELLHARISTRQSKRKWKDCLGM
jgi:hypothetical protein